MPQSHERLPEEAVVRGQHDLSSRAHDEPDGGIDPLERRDGAKAQPDERGQIWPHPDVPPLPEGANGVHEAGLSG